MDALPSPEEMARAAQSAAEGLLSAMGFTATVRVSAMPEGGVRVVIESGESDALIGESGEGIEAFQYLDRALTINPDLWRTSDVICYNIATVYRRYGKKEQAVEYLRKALELNPDSEKARALLAEIAGR